MLCYNRIKWSPKVSTDFAIFLNSAPMLNLKQAITTSNSPSEIITIFNQIASACNSKAPPLCPTVTRPTSWFDTDCLKGKVALRKSYHEARVLKDPTLFADYTLQKRQYKFLTNTRSVLITKQNGITY